uniref:Uncharacterized protein n=1 Tax=viral metagenome TaxID=1070528 RepID=A0A6H1ZXX3_9ZZZZ
MSGFKIYRCFFSIELPEGGRVHGYFDSGKTVFSATSGIPDEKSKWKGASFHSDEDQERYKKILEGAIATNHELF